MGAVECARALHELVLNEFGGRRDVWLEAAKFERSLATDTDEAGEANAHEGDKSAGSAQITSASNRVAAILRRAVSARPKDVTLWLMAAKNAWKENKNVAEARSLLEAAFEANPKSDAILLAAQRVGPRMDSTQEQESFLRERETGCPEWSCLDEKRTA